MNISLKKKMLAIGGLVAAVAIVVTLTLGSTVEVKAEIWTLTDKYPINVYFFDVGKADSILIECEGEYVLIDAGTAAVGDDVCEYLQNLGVTELKTVFATHTDKDHIGGMAAVLNNFTVGELVQSPITDELLPDSDEYASLMTAADTYGLNGNYSSVGDVYTVGGATLTVLGPVSDDYDDVNDFSIVLKLEYGDFSVLLCGDSEADSEKDMVAAYTNGELSADVIKIPHHGSSDASKKSFLKAVGAEYAVISTADNGNELPSDKVLERLEDLGTTVYRTDLNGHIVCSYDGSEIIFTTQN